MTYRVALIGAGHIGGRHARQWAALDGAEVVGVLDPDGGAASALGTAYADWDALINQARPDIIDICAPTTLHREYAERAASAGKAVFVEKPLARTLADCDAIVEAVARANVPAMCGQVLRFFPEYAAARRLVTEGGVGTPAAVRTARLSGPPGSKKPTDELTGKVTGWYADAARSGGVTLDSLVHDFDWLRWTFGPVRRVFARGASDYALVTLRFESGAVGHVTGSWAHTGFCATLEVAGDAGLIEHDSAQSAPLSGGESPLDGSDDPYCQELTAFVRALADGAAPPVSVAEGREAVRIALAALESMETGKVVTL